MSYNCSCHTLQECNTILQTRMLHNTTVSYNTDQCHILLQKNMSYNATMSYNNTKNVTQHNMCHTILQPTMSCNDLCHTMKSAIQHKSVIPLTIVGTTIMNLSEI